MRRRQSSSRNWAVPRQPCSRGFFEQAIGATKVTPVEVTTD
jgi:hypothetical protein